MKALRVNLLLVLPLLATACSLEPPPASSGVTQNPLKVATWNLEHLAEQNGLGCRPRSDEDYAALRKHVEALNADVIAFQEVESKAAAERVFDPAQYDIVISGRPAAAPSGECYDVPGQSIRQQDVGFAIRKGVRWTRNADVVELGLGNPGLRWGVDLTLEGPSSLRLLAVHLKSGCNAGRSAEDADCPVLFDQLPVLERWIDQRVAAGEAFAILGDWNRRLSGHGDAFFSALDRSLPATADLAIASADRRATCKARFPEFIDHIVIGASAATQVLPGSFAEYTYGLAEEQHPSDHCPVSVLMRR